MACPLLQVFVKRLRGHFARDVLAIDDRRRQPTGANTSRGHQRYFAVWSGCSRLNTQIVLRGCEKLRAALDIASRAQADHASMLSRGFQSKEVIKGRDSV